MKKSRFLILLLFAGLFLVLKLEAQTAGPTLNQNELMKKFVGLWYLEGTNHLISEIRQFGTDALEGYQKAELKDSLSYYQFVFGYDKTKDRYLAAAISKNGKGIKLMAFKFISENVCERSSVESVNNDDQSEATYEFRTPDLLIGTFKDQNKKDIVYRLVRGKKPI